MTSGGPEIKGDAPNQERSEKKEKKNNKKITTKEKVQIIQSSLTLYSGDVPFCI